MTEKLAKTLQDENANLLAQFNKLLLRNQELQFQLEDVQLAIKESKSEDALSVSSVDAVTAGPEVSISISICSLDLRPLEAKKEVAY